MSMPSIALLFFQKSGRTILFWWFTFKLKILTAIHNMISNKKLLFLLIVYFLLKLKIVFILLLLLLLLL